MASDVQYYKRLKEAELTSSTDGNLANTAGSIIAQVQTRGLQVPMATQANANAYGWLGHNSKTPITSSSNLTCGSH